MRKHFRKTLVTAAVAGAMGISAPASAFVYGLSHLTIEDFIFAGNANVTVESFTFRLTNTATLNGTSVINTAQCSGTPGPGNNNCGQFPAATLDAAAAQVGIAAPQNTYTFVGPNGTNYARSDSIVPTAQLVDGIPSSLNSIAENNLVSTGNAADSAQLQSTTTVSFTVAPGGPGASFTLSFNADADLRTAISGIATSGTSQAQVQATFGLVKSGGGSLTWSPDGNLSAGDCSVNGILAGLGGACSETADGGGAAEASLNNTIGTGANPSDIQYSFDAANVFHPYSILVTGLPAGTYTLSLSTLVSDDKTARVPEPASLALIGLGLLGMGVNLRRRSRKA